MALSRFYVQIIDKMSGVVAMFPGGGPMEADFVETCTKYLVPTGSTAHTSRTFLEQKIKEIAARDVGVFSTKAHVEAVLREVLLTDLENTTVLTTQDVKKALIEALREVKSHTRFII